MKPYLEEGAKQLFLTGPDPVLDHPWFAELDPLVFSRFKTFHAEHPELLDLYSRFAREARRSGRKGFGMKAIAERVRWNLNVEQVGTADDLFMVNNNYLSAYARLLMLTYPELEGMFELRSKHEAPEE